MTAPARPTLTQRELDVLTRMANGDTYASIANAYGIGHRTACWIGQRVMQKLGARNITNAVHVAHHVGLLPACQGDRASYLRHLRLGEPTHAICRAANARHAIEQRAGRLTATHPRQKPQEAA